jgi:hypothetical protein
MVCGCDEKPFPLRTDAPPKEWKADAINDGLPRRWEKGTVHVLAWEAIEDRSDERKSILTQVLVLKRFDEPTEKGQHRWVLAQVYYFPDDKERPWRRSMIVPPPPLPGEKMPKVTDAHLFGHEFYNDLPTDKQIEVFLSEARWTPDLGPYTAFTIADGKVVDLKCVRSIAAGGVDPILWKKLFKRDVPTNLFPELKKATDGKK